MFNRTAFIVLSSLLAWAQLSHGTAEGNLSRDGFAKIVSQIEDEEARSFFEELAATGSSYAFPVVWDLAELTAEDLWMQVDGEETAVEETYLAAFLRAMAAAGVTLTADGKTVTYKLGESPPAGEGKKRSVGQAEAPPKKAKGKPATKKATPGKKSGVGAPEGPTYRLSCKYGSGLTYGDVVLSAEEDAGKLYCDFEVAAVVDALTFKDFPYNRDGDAQKLFRENQKKMEGLMSSPWGREKVLGTYAYYDLKDQRWKMELLEEILEYYDLGTIAKE
ncbi:MAG: hypothetical protein V3W11_04835 [bacterium]